LTAKETALLNTVRLSFTFSVVSVMAVMTGGLGRVRLGRVHARTAVNCSAAALGVFGWFEVADFYVFLGCCHNISSAVSGYWFVLCKRHQTTSDARQ
jgi:hypothetical protein